MKAFEVKLSITGSSKNKTKIVFVEAKTKKEIQQIEDVLKVWERKDIEPIDCEMRVVNGLISKKTDIT